MKFLLLNHIHNELIYKINYQKKDLFLREHDEGAEAIKKIYPEYEHYIADAPLRGKEYLFIGKI